MKVQKNIRNSHNSIIYLQLPKISFFITFLA